MATNNALKFYRKSEAPSNVAAGAIWFNTSDKTIQIYTGTEWEKYAGNLNNATWANNTLTITKHDGSSIALDFSDMASAAMLGKMLAAIDLNTDGTFKKHATNYGSSAKTIGAEINAIDAKLKSVSDLVGTDSVSKQVGDAKTELIGADTDAKNANTIYGAKAHASFVADDAKATAKGYMDNALEALTDTVSSTADEKVVVSVTQTNGKVETVAVTLDDIASAAELANVKKTAEDAQTAGEVSAAITNAINGLDADKSGQSTDKHVKVQVVEADGKITAVAVTTADIASAATLKTVKDKVDAFFAGASIDDTVDQYKDTLLELQTYINDDAAAAVTMTGNIAANKADVRELATATVNGHAIGEVVEDKIVAQTIVLNGSDIKLDGYSKHLNDNVVIVQTDTINAALGKLEAKADKALTDAANAAAAGVTSLNGKTGAITIATGTSNGSIKVGDADVAVKGLGSAAYTASTAYATAAQGTKADSALQAITSANTAAIEIANNSVVTPKIASNNELASMSYITQAAGNSPLVDAAGAQHLVKTYVDNTIEDALTWAEF